MFSNRAKALGSPGGSPSRETGNALRLPKKGEGEAPTEPAEALGSAPRLARSQAGCTHFGRAKLLLSRRWPDESGGVPR